MTSGPSRCHTTIDRVSCSPLRGRRHRPRIYTYESAASLDEFEAVRSEDCALAARSYGRCRNFGSWRGPISSIDLDIKPPPHDASRTSPRNTPALRARGSTSCQQPCPTSSPSPRSVRSRRRSLSTNHFSLWPRVRCGSHTPLRYASYCSLVPIPICSTLSVPVVQTLEERMGRLRRVHPIGCRVHFGNNQQRPIPSVPCL